MGVLVASVNLRAVGSEQQRANNVVTFEQTVQGLEMPGVEIAPLELGERAVIVRSELGPSIQLLAKDNQYMMGVSGETEQQVTELAEALLQRL